MLMPLLIVAVGSAVVGGMAAVGLASMASWSQGAVQWRSVLLGSGTGFVGAMLAIGALWALSGPDGRGLTQGLLSMGMVRMISMLAIGLALSRTMPVEARTFWAAVLAAGALALAFETAIVARFLARHSATRTRTTA